MDDVDEAIESAIKNIRNAPQEEPIQKETMKRAFENRVSEDVSNDEADDRKAPVISRKFAKFRSPAPRSDSQRSGKLKIKSVSSSGKPPSGVNKSRDTGKYFSEKTRITPSSGGTSSGPALIGGMKVNSLKHRVKLMPGSGKKSVGKLSLSNSSRKKMDGQSSSLNGSVRGKLNNISRLTGRKGSANPRPTIAMPGKFLTKPMPPTGSTGFSGRLSSPNVQLLANRSGGFGSASSLPRKKATISTKSAK